MDRTRNAVLNFAINFFVGYVLGRVLRDRDTGVRAGVVLGALGAVASWRLAERFEVDAVEPTAEPIEIEIEDS
ncbi:hypothetical protein C475_03114 [Halosimplex carlsbadense 2-9-1]|uniref:Uncharacterized protein n=1 Tax=Halosimplex carlsbadense 2-9-1 TaxID=797114 RepID=M0D2V2_9EURY|nr:hypothetical protein [Halosimplex carlsbadense]ELZ29173.1 hypothetical protein C475_03114 [Halosimplex carlsbadense 2-9-1]